MATSLITEEESGVSRGFQHPHNGYYAGDFGQDEIPPGCPTHVSRPF